MLIRRVALILRIGASLFFFASLILLFKPELVAGYIGFDSAVVTPELRWILQMMGAVFLVPALLAPVVAAFAGERGLRQAASGMTFIWLAIATLMVFAPVKWGNGKFSVIAIGYLFSFGYIYALRGRRRNR